MTVRIMCVEDEPAVITSYSIHYTKLYEYGHIDFVVVQQRHRHGLFQVARRQPPEAPVHQVVAAVAAQVDEISYNFV